jgi:hypothetical protein
MLLARGRLASYISKISMNVYCRIARRSICLTVVLFMLSLTATAQILPFPFPLPNAQAGVFYAYPNLHLACAGQCTNYSIFSGSLPPGLAIDSSTGRLSGTPIVPGVYTFRWRAIVLPNGFLDGETVSVTYSLTVTLPNAVGAPISPISLLVTMMALATVGLLGTRRLRKS